jgi:hypothetical protein
VIRNDGDVTADVTLLCSGNGLLEHLAASIVAFGDDEK